MSDTSLQQDQQTIATSSGEAELYSIGSGVSEGLQFVNCLQEMKLFQGASLKLHTDSSAAKSISNRFGPGKQTKHIALRYLFVQDLVRSGILSVAKINTLLNFSDCLTKYITGETLRRHVSQLGLNEECSRSDNYMVS